MSQSDFVHTSVIELLKEYTAPVHRQLESTGIAKNILADDVSVDQVVQFLLANYRCLSGLEKILEQVFEQEPGKSTILGKRGYIFQAPKISRDLTRLKIYLPEVYSLGFSSNYFHALGGLYVLMGSQFGKSIIRKHLTKKNHPLLCNLSFFDASEGLADRWRSFAQALDKEIVSAEQLKECQRGAEDFFSHFLMHWKMLSRDLSSTSCSV